MTDEPRGPILIVEQDRQFGQGLAEQLAADGYAVDVARSCEHARILAGGRAPALVVLGLVDESRGALGLLGEIRCSGAPARPWDPRLPAVVIGWQAGELDVLRAFEAGADDFLVRACSYVELRARLRAILRHASWPSNAARVIEVGPIVVDTAARAVTVAGNRVELRRMEFDLLVHLAREPRRVFSCDELLRTVWGYRAGARTRTVACHASRVRRKLAVNDDRGWVVNVRSVGYRLI